MTKTLTGNKKHLRWILPLSLVLLIAVLWVIFGGSAASEREDLIVKAERGEFRIDITTTGELEAKNSVRIMGPNGLRMARLWQVKIDDLVDEGTVVEKGQYIGRLDKSELSDRIKNLQNEFQQNESQYIQTRLDTALELRQARNSLIDMRFAVEEAQLRLDQSQYEPQATIRQAELDLDKTKRGLSQAQKDYSLKKEKAAAKMREAAAKLGETQNDLEFLQKLEKDFVITAPEPGMLIYHREFNGQKRAKGAVIGPWDPTVATLPDLTKMISKTYVNEVDIRKVKTGQKVKIGLDAFPEKQYRGVVNRVANVGEQRPNSDAKVFEVSIELMEADTTLRPAMTTSNVILTEIVGDAVYVPLEALHSQGDSLTYVFSRNGASTVKKQVEIGKANSNEVIIAEGIAEGEEVYLSVPDGGEEASMVMLEGEKDSQATQTSALK
ncbi:MAG: HlyD family secretion protein [Cyclobacteriaceae bacterium]